MQDGRGKYYGMAPLDGDFEKNGRVLVVSRPNQETNDRLLVLDHRRGKTREKIPLESRDTHHAVRRGDELLMLREGSSDVWSVSISIDGEARSLEGRAPWLPGGIGVGAGRAAVGGSGDGRGAAWRRA